MGSTQRQNSFQGEYVEGTVNQIRANRQNIDGTQASISPFVRMIVLDVIYDPTILDDNAKNYYRSLGIANDDIVDSLPRNTLLAKQVADGSAGCERPPMFVYPFFAHVSFPVKPGEHVWVLMYPDLEKKTASVAYWMSRIVEPHCVDDPNHTHPPRVWDASYVKGTKEQWEASTDITYDYANGRMTIDADGNRTLDASTAPLVDSPFSTKIVDAYVDLQQKTNAGKLSTIEPVPRYRKRPDEFVIEGSNNALLVIGAERGGAPAEYDVDPETETKVAKIPQGDHVGSAGTFDIVVGRGQTKRTMGKVAENSLGFKEIAKSLKNDDPEMANEGDPDFKNDRARVWSAQRTSVDSRFSIDAFNVQFDGVRDSDNGDSATVIKADKVRIIARSDVEFLVSGFDRDENGNMVERTDTDSMAALIIKSDGSIVLKPSKLGVIKLGDDTADKAILCTDSPATVNPLTGEVAASPIISTAGGIVGNGSMHGLFAKKVLVKG